MGKKDHFQKAQLYCVTNTSQKWDVSCQSFTPHKSLKFLRIWTFFDMICLLWPLKTSKLGHFWDAQLYCLINTSRKWGLSSQNFSSHIFSSFLGQTCCFWHAFSWGAWVSKSQTLIFERYGFSTWPILARYEPWVAKNFLHMYCQSFGSIHVASRWVCKVSGSHFPLLDTMIPDF